MVARRPHLDLLPGRCDQCGRCLDACSRSAVKVGPSYIYIDWASCEGCIACAEACERGAISVKDPAHRVIEPAIREGAVFTVSNPPAEAGSRGTWTMSEMAVVVAAMLTLLVLKDMLLSSSIARSLSFSGSVALRTLAQAIYYGVLLWTLVWLANRRGERFREAFRLTRPSWLSSAGWVVAALFALRLLSTMYGAIAQAIGWDPPVGPATDLTAWFGNDAAGLALGMVAVVVLGPFVEEVVFRGMLLEGLKSYVGTRTAVVVSAFLFAASHLTLWAFVPLSLLGMALGWLATSRGSIWPAVALHSLYNAVALVAAFYVSGVLGV